MCAGTVNGLGVEMPNVRFCAAALVVLVAAACGTTEQAPVTGRSQTMLVSEREVVQESGKAYGEVVAKYQDQGKLDADPQQLERVRRVVLKLVPQAVALRPETAQWRWEVHLAQLKTVNAWCMAGGKMMVYSGLIETLQLSDDELAGVLAHEISHAIAKHQQERISHEQRRELITLPFSIAAKLFLPIDPTSTLSELAFGLPFTREQEAEADRIGLTIMTRAGYNPNAMVTLFEKFKAHQQAGGTPEFLSTHPSDETRIETIRGVIQSDPEIRQRAT